MPVHPYLSKKPTTALKESYEEKKKLFNKMKVLGALIISIPAVIGAWQTYKYTSINYPIWNASIYKINDNGKIRRIWDKGNVSNIEEFKQLLPGVLNTKNERLLKGLEGVIIQFHTEDRAEMIGGNYDSKNNIIHIYPHTTSGVLLHEVLHHIYDKVLTEEERTKFNTFAKKVYNVLKNASKPYDGLKAELTPELFKYFEKANEILVKRTERYRGMFSSEEEYIRFFASELFAAAFDFKDFGIAAEVKSIYSSYLNEEVVAQFINTSTTNMF